MNGVTGTTLGGATTSRPNWPIIDSRNYRERSIYPETHNDGFLRTDYLLVTKIPNFLTPGSLAGKTIISFGGTHGVATRATSLLLNSPGLMKRLVDDYHDGRSPHFQALFKATSIIHEPRGGSHAKQLSLEALVPLSFDDVVLDESRRTVNARFTDWAGRGHRAGSGCSLIVLQKHPVRADAPTPNLHWIGMGSGMQAQRLHTLGAQLGAAFGLGRELMAGGAPLVPAGCGVTQQATTNPLAMRGAAHEALVGGVRPLRAGLTHRPACPNSARGQVVSPGAQGPIPSQQRCSRSSACG